MMITGAMIAWYGWFGLMLGTVVVAAFLVYRKRWPGAGWGLVTILGGLLTFAFVSAVVGLYEVPSYYTQSAFYVSLGIGVVGAGLVGGGVSRLRTKPAQ